MKEFYHILLLFGVLFQNPEVAVCGNAITINTDRQMIAGYTEGVYNDAKSQVTNVDDIMEGGDSFGKVKNGITKANVDLGFTIPNNANIVIKGDEISITNEQGNAVGTLNIADQKASNEGGSVFPITVKDKEGNVYKIAPKEDADQALADGTPLQINKVSGQSGDGLEVYALYPNGDGYYNLGKLMVVSYPEKTIRLKVVPVNGGKANAESLQQALNSVYNPVGISIQVIVDRNFNYSGNMELMAQGSGLLQAYTPAMRDLQSAYATERGIDNNSAYLFYINGGNGANRTDRDATAFMPRGKQFAYVFSAYHPDLTTSAPVVAHELGHGVFQLKHTFDPAYQLTERSTDNLMDYAGGAHLAKWQWDAMHDPGLVIGLFEKDGDGMVIGEVLGKVHELDPAIAYLSPAGSAILIPNIKRGAFNEDGGLIKFILADGTEYHTAYTKDAETFVGYFTKDVADEIRGIPTIEGDAIIKNKQFTGYTFAPKNAKVFAYAKLVQQGKYVDCFCGYTWVNAQQSKSLTGKPKLPIVSSTATKNDCTGSQCDFAINIDPGIGFDLFKMLQPNLPDTSNQSKATLGELCNYLTKQLDGKRYRFFGIDGALAKTMVTADFAKYFKEYNLFSLESFQNHFDIFQQGAADCDIIISHKDPSGKGVDLWEGINRDTYNQFSIDYTSYKVDNVSNMDDLRWHFDFLSNVALGLKDASNTEYLDNFLNSLARMRSESTFMGVMNATATVKECYAVLGFYEPYQYTFNDLVHRKQLKSEALKQSILQFEGRGNATSIADASQIIAQYNSTSSFFVGAEYVVMIDNLTSSTSKVNALRSTSKVFRDINLSDKKLVASGVKQVSKAGTISYKNNAYNRLDGVKQAAVKNKVQAYGSQYINHFNTKYADADVTALSEKDVDSDYKEWKKKADDSDANDREKPDDNEEEEDNNECPHCKALNPDKVFCAQLISLVENTGNDDAVEKLCKEIKNRAVLQLVVSELLTYNNDVQKVFLEDIQGTSENINHLCMHVSGVDVEIVKAWKYLYDIGTQSGRKLDWLLLREVSENIQDVTLMDYFKVPKSETVDKYQQFLRKYAGRCNTCDAPADNTYAGLKDFPATHITLRNLVDFARKFHTTPGYKDILAGAGEGVFTQDGTLFFLRYIESINADIHDFEGNINLGDIDEASESTECRYDIRMDIDDEEHFVELKSYTLSSLRSTIDKMIQNPNAPNAFRKQFKAYLNGTLPFRYVFNSKKINDTTAIKKEFQRLFTNPTQAKILFEENRLFFTERKIYDAKALFEQVHDDLKNNSLFNFIIIY